MTASFSGSANMSLANRSRFSASFVVDPFAMDEAICRCLWINASTADFTRKRDRVLWVGLPDMMRGVRPSSINTWSASSTMAACRPLCIRSSGQ